MSETVAIVGSRRGASLEAVKDFVHALYAMQPDTILVSGGADGVDKLAEQTWLELGGKVWSYRVREIDPIRFSIELWRLGDEEPMVERLVSEPTFADRASALFYRDSLIAEKAKRVVAFYRRGRSAGTQVTVDFATAYGRDIYEYEAAA